MDEDPIRLRVTAETCRRLVGAFNDAETVARLTDLAEECEAKLSAMADRFDVSSNRSQALARSRAIHPRRIALHSGRPRPSSA
jgi:hypothetical protein